METQEIQPVKQDFFLLEQPQREIISSLEKFFGELITGHTAYQIKNFIIGQFHTPDRKHHQALRELYARYVGLVQQHYEAKKLQIEIGRAEIKLRQAQDGLKLLDPAGAGKGAKDTVALRTLDVEEADAELEFKRWQLENLKLAVKGTLREMVVFKQELGRLTPQRKYAGYEEAEPEYWETQFAAEYLKGKRGDNLPKIPDAGTVTAIVNKALEACREGKRTIDIGALIGVRREEKPLLRPHCSGLKPVSD